MRTRNGQVIPYEHKRGRCYRDREKLRWELEKILEPEDSLLIAGLCGRCVERIQACNRPETWTVEQERFRIF
ncbi:MAG: hypothetical protein JO235_25525 [Chroococcidiopsidaceae cyanobacterium CP_BM_RX_35]|nr:hypothetical protein [Chroococcidiopsidaceae cyanobacterium CP_BM_RX_35]